MARQQFPMMTPGGGMVKKVVLGLVAIALLALVVKHPSDAAGWATGAVHLVTRVIDGITSFFQHL